ncbi:hypothetical protein AA23498_1024 [Acetobacter nitrogenifigens DSM 23921 = NBRC 105050]|uniref:DUF423 domain-containing protein n=1 Tax=Acetobacter nitrogenifigens DSM 23921 = NBRC 105050 TaxID=1120919 RepID=A0A511XAT0_9PROT|nr:DUF423 domain-containing protein [Acetobacter nitrogenifigens]GBQ90932.1 hypothetical protein AA23498_1024 [Acetobacter nitrogenifigens DSM 23921 = NBRC 105050]GEN60050.1 hypothetical protein ANI02nite_19340 [Acetobacter nitrogenifigens DSM 23921 = NBRC 105050]
MLVLMARFWRSAGALLACAAVAMGAVTAHLPAERFGLGAGREIAHSAVEMHMWHALALVGLGLGARKPTRLMALGGNGLVLGTLIFCGALYFTAFTGHHLGAVAPTGGSILILSWFVLAVAFAIHE